MLTFFILLLYAFIALIVLAQMTRVALKDTDYAVGVVFLGTLILFGGCGLAEVALKGQSSVEKFVKSVK